MQPEIMITSLMAHFSPRDHETPDMAKLWFAQMIDGVKGYPASAREKALKTIIRTRTQRSFPLLGEIIDAISAELPAPSPTPFNGPSHRREQDQNEQYRSQLAKEWRDKVCAEYGSMDKYLHATATDRNRNAGYGAPGVSSRRSTFKGLSETSKRMTGEA